MLGALPAQLPWWLTGPSVGLCVLALYGLANARLGVSGAWLAATVAPVEGWRGERWRVVFWSGCSAARCWRRCWVRGWHRTVTAGSPSC